LIFAFRESLSSSILGLFPDHDPVKKLRIDGYAGFANLNTRLCDEISQLSPFGAGNPAPVLVSRNLEIQSQALFGKQEAHRKLVLVDPQGETQQAIMWNASRFAIPVGSIDLAFNLRTDPSSSLGGVTLEYIDHREVQPDSIYIPDGKPTIKVFDFRTAEKTAADILAEVQPGDLILWGEGTAQDKSPNAVTRLGLFPARTLAILSPPPDTATLADALHKVNPREIYLFAEIPSADHLDGFLKNLAGLIKYCQKVKNGVTDVVALAAALGHSRESVINGLEWWRARGKIDFLLAEDHIQFSPSSNQSAGDMENITRSLQKTLMETAAFRSYYTRADPNHLIYQHLG
jgi:single-stranded-DNA-specific exonuclease